jgi:hypothetical protein
MKKAIDEAMKKMENAGGSSNWAIDLSGMLAT